LEPITPVDSSDDSSASSGRGTPAELPPVPGQVLPSDHEVNRWLDGTSPSDNAAAALDGLPPLPTPRRHSTSEPRRRTTQSLGVSPAAFECFHARRLSRPRVVQYLPAFVPDSDSDTEAPASARPGVSVRTSEITPVQLPLSHHPSGALQHTLPSRPITPPPAQLQSVPIPAMTPNGDALQPPPLPAYRRASTIGRSTQHTPQCPHPSRQLYRRVFACSLHGGRCIDSGLTGAREVLARRNIGTAPLPDSSGFGGSTSHRKAPALSNQKG